ncbi:MAG: archaellin/type IV pilin N-terminal domain-containing protein [Candidatus Heimdallarchaeota archaeon]
MKLFRKITKKRRAVSPILAAILLIGLAITAGAVLFVVVLPLITAPGGGLEIASTFKFLNTTATPHYDKASIPLSNTAAGTITVSDISITGTSLTNGTDIAVTITFSSFTIPSGQSKIQEYSIADPIHDLTSYSVTVTYAIGDGDTQTVSATWTPQ